MFIRFQWDNSALLLSALVRLDNQADKVAFLIRETLCLVDHVPCREKEAIVAEIEGRSKQLLKIGFFLVNGVAADWHNIALKITHEGLPEVAAKLGADFSAKSARLITTTFIGKKSAKKSEGLT